MQSLQPQSFNYAAPPTLQWQPPQIKNFLAVSGKAYPVNTTANSITVTLPLSPNIGDQITLTDYAGTWNTNSCTINANGNKIIGQSSVITGAIGRGSIQLVYVDATQGWIGFAGIATVYPVQIPPSTIEYLIVAGGGGGGGAQGGGGGAGGFRTNSGLSVSAGVAYTINVGAGGAGGPPGGNTRGSPGANSYISGTGIVADPAAPGNPTANAITSFGGGGGGVYSAIGTTAGIAGGSGGGGGANGGNGAGGAGNTPSTSPSQGNNGGSGLASNYAVGGGGGAGAVGSNGSSSPNAGGNGGAGTASSITGTSVTYAGGGGGSASAPNPSGSGGAGGGGAGASGPNNGTNGSANTGGGGGGASGATGGTGGSGIVVIRYPDTNAAANTTGSPTVTVSGGYRIYTWTGNGSIAW